MSPRARAPGRPVASLVLMVSGLLALLAPGVAPAQGDPGQFEVRAASLELRSGVYYLNAWIEYRLSADARTALESGVPITIRLEVDLLRSRRFWLDAERAALMQRYQLQYHALSERYIIRNLNSGDQSSFATLFSALNALGRVDRLPLIDAALLEPRASYSIRVRAALDTEDLPGPLKLLTFWRRDWSIASDWYEWELVKE